MSLNYIEIGRLISTARKAAKMSQSELADKAGTDQSYISRIENGEKAPNLEVLVSIANVLGTGVDNLLGRNLSEQNHEAISPVEMIFADCTSKERETLTRLMLFLADTLIGHLK